jgi:hypothetical protein
LKELQENANSMDRQEGLPDLSTLPLSQKLEIGLKILEQIRDSKGHQPIKLDTVYYDIQTGEITLAAKSPREKSQPVKEHSPDHRLFHAPEQRDEDLFSTIDIISGLLRLDHEPTPEFKASAGEYVSHTVNASPEVMRGQEVSELPTNPTELQRMKYVREIESKILSPQNVSDLRFLISHDLEQLHDHGARARVKFELGEHTVSPAVSVGIEYLKNHLKLAKQFEKESEQAERRSIMQSASECLARGFKQISEILCCRFVMLNSRPLADIDLGDGYQPLPDHVERKTKR